MTATDAGMPAVPTNFSPSTPHETHPVLNQPPARADINEFTANIPPQEFLFSVGEAEVDGALEASGAVVGSAQFQDDARLAHRNPPILHTHSRHGQRIDDVEYHPSYHRIIGQAVAAGAHTSAWNRSCWRRTSRRSDCRGCTRGPTDRSSLRASRARCLVWP